MAAHSEDGKLEQPSKFRGERSRNSSHVSESIFSKATGTSTVSMPAMILVLEAGDMLEDTCEKLGDSRSLMSVLLISMCSGSNSWSGSNSRSESCLSRSWLLRRTESVSSTFEGDLGTSLSHGIPRSQLESSMLPILAKGSPRTVKGTIGNLGKDLVCLAKPTPSTFGELREERPLGFDTGAMQPGEDALLCGRFALAAFGQHFFWGTVELGDVTLPAAATRPHRETRHEWWPQPAWPQADFCECDACFSASCI